MDKKAAEVFKGEHEKDDGDHRTPGTLVLTLIFLACFALYYFANWKALADVWHLR
jgi:hypothetical protein